MSVNLVVLGGNVTKDPEMRQVGESKVVKFSIAVSRPYKKNDRNVTDFFECEMWGNRADYVSTHAVKGVPVVVTGRVEIDVSEKDGVTRRFTKIKCDDVEIYPKRNSSNNSTSDSADQTVAPPPTPKEESSVEDDSELPF